MELVELAIEGLRGFPTAWRAEFGPALNLVGPVDGRHTVVVRALRDLLYPQSNESALERLVDEAQPHSRIAVCMVGRDGQTYRIIRDLRTGRVSALKKGQGGYTPLCDTPAQVAQMVTAQMGFPQEDVFLSLLVTRAGDLPSRRHDEERAASTPAAEDVADEPVGGGDSWNRPLPPGFSEDNDAGRYDHLDAGAKREKLAELKKRLGGFERMKALEFEIDGLQKTAFALDETLRPVDHLRMQLNQAKEQVSRMRDLGDVPEDLPLRYDQIRQARQQFDEKRRELAAQKDKLNAQLARMVQDARTIWQVVQAAAKSPLVIYGVLGAVAAIALGVIGLFGPEPLRYVAMLDVVGFAVATFGAWRLIDEAQFARRLKVRVEGIEKAEAKENQRLELDEKAWSGLLKRLTATEDDIDHLADEMRLYRQAMHAVRSAQAALDEAIRPDELEVKEAERDRVSAEIKRKEDELYALGGGFVGNKEDLLAQVQELEDDLAGRTPVKKAAPPPTPEPSGPTPAAPGGATVVSPHVVEALVDHASDIFLCDTDGVVTMIRARASQILAFFADGRFSQMSFTATGAPEVLDAASGRAVAYANLPPGDRDLVYLALKIAILEAAVKRARLPVIWEQAFEAFMPQKDPALAKLVAYLASSAQVVMMTTRKALLGLPAQAHRLPAG